MSDEIVAGLREAWETLPVKTLVILATDVGANIGGRAELSTIFFRTLRKHGYDENGDLLDPT